MNRKVKMIVIFMHTQKLPEKDVVQQQERSIHRHAVPEENNGFTGDTFLATLLDVIGP